MSFIAEEIARQPDSWRAAAGRLDLDALPQPGERIAVVGCGTSWFMAESYARLREEAGLGESDAWAASEFPAHRDYHRIVAITRSGTTTEVSRLLADQRGRVPTTVLTTLTSSPAASLADRVIELDFADESSVVQTVFATTALALLRAQLGHDVPALATAAETALASQLPDAWADAEQITFLGSGWAHGIAREAALKMREAAQLWTEAYPGMEYRHGPISIAEPGRLVWQLGAGDGALRAEVEATGAGFVSSGSDPMVELILVQRLAERIAVGRGLDPDRPRGLSRSVVLGAG
ncbi:MAG: sugar isomerase [Actinomycetota bacterium]|nr:sugar isomerase [Actinomycetota bacterium]MDQ2956484.1 sugar isomerase [Actinomycetota bacterium]